jgi:hypothetical protein
MKYSYKDSINWLITKYKTIPQQVSHLLILFIIFMVIFISGRRLLIPDTFGVYGHYRAAAVDSNMADSLVHAGHLTCAECHDDVAEIKSESYHRGVACETCHGPGYDHTQAPDEHTLPAPRERGYCVLCHSYNPSRPTGFPQIDQMSHNPGKPCMSCHDPHAPQLPNTPESCSACHAEIARTKAVSHHQNLSCIRCHEALEEHKITPRAYLPTVPKTREFCGECHSESAEGDIQVARIDMALHGENYNCWQCHYPHYPEAY